MDDERESIWSVPRWAKRSYYVLFTLFMLVGIYSILWSISPTAKTNAERLAELYRGIGSVAIASAGLSLLVIELMSLGGSIMVMGAWIIEKVREQQRKELADKIDQTFGKGTFERLEQEKSKAQNPPQSDKNA
jgi:hypothetical protein